MSLGETIYRLRTEKNLSQGDLAEMLEVSRQSVSKWENNSAVPDLEKLIKLGKIFDISLDELVNGTEAPHKVENATPLQEVKKAEAGFSPRKIAGTILFCLAFFVVLFCLMAGDVLAGLILALPFLSCGIICFALKQNVGLWCAWDIYVLFDLYMSYATGISRSSVLYTFQWTHHMNYMRLAFAWFLLVSLVVMIAVTVVRFWKRPFASRENGRKYLLISWAVVIVLQAAAMLWVRTNVYQYIMENIFTMDAVYRVVNLFLSWSRIVAVTVALVVTGRVVRTRKRNEVL